MLQKNFDILQTSLSFLYNYFGSFQIYIYS